MWATDQDALLCDMAETYHVYDLRGLPVRTLAALACGLRPTSRIRQKMAGTDYSPDTLLLAMIADNLSTLVWITSGSAQNGGVRPQSMVELITGKDGRSKPKTQVFASGEDFQAAREKILKRV